ncbi:MAG TPA: altronate hydrolase, partial [Erysipelotrichaceae bacterium]|nr:altronate hydrolase [Erysipelotrichaceae bacterium]
MDKKWIQINSADNVAVALAPLRKGETIEIGPQPFVLKEDIAQGHKFALQDIEADENIIKYGLAIGHALDMIRQGQWVHIHNMKTNLGDILEYTYDKKVLDKLQAGNERTFQGYRRKNGKVGIRNEIWI